MRDYFSRDPDYLKRRFYDYTHSFSSFEKVSPRLWKFEEYLKWEDFGISPETYDLVVLLLEIIRGCDAEIDSQGLILLDAIREKSSILRKIGDSAG